MFAVRATILGTALFASALGLAACSSSKQSAPAGATPADTILIKNFGFQPTTLVVAPGAKVTVHNEDSATHTVTNLGAPKGFDTGDINAGATMTFTAPTAPGTYQYTCTIHQFMHGTLQVR